MKYAFIEAQRGQHAVATLCRVLEVSSIWTLRSSRRRHSTARLRTARARTRIQRLANINACLIVLKSPPTIRATQSRPAISGETAHLELHAPMGDVGQHLLTWSKSAI